MEILLSDFDEVKTHNTDPSRWDTDAGGRTDGEEILFDATDPLEPADDLPSTNSILFLDDSLGFEWRLFRDGSTSSRDQIFSTSYQLLVNGERFDIPGRTVLVGQEGRGLVAGPTIMSGVEVFRKTFVPPTFAFFRGLDIFRNGTDADIELSLEMRMNSNNSSRVREIFRSEYGDEVLAQAVVLDDQFATSGMPPGAQLFFTEATQVVFDGGDLVISTDITVPAGGIVSMMHVALSRRTREDAQEEILRLGAQRATGGENELFLGMSSEEIMSLIP